jgi:hypothetical protein
MISDTDLPHQPDTLQQPPLMEKKSSPIWTLIFSALFSANLGIILWLLVGFNFGRDINLGLLGFVPHLFLLFIIDFFAILFYIKTQHPGGKVKTICYIVLIPISYFLIQFLQYFIWLFFRF